ncbi:hypothetical protein ACIQYL_25530 [Lysinibacillus xylanilyticus]|uniref:hypothetical protein n=1 Tax=Lysinibacillus xylanilyticus TaxID=582475 RepID=UPI003817B6A7
MKTRELEIQDFSLLDSIIIVGNKTLTIMLTVKDKWSITQQDAYKLYLGGQILQKTVEYWGEPFFVPINEVCKYQ